MNIVVRPRPRFTRAAVWTDFYLRGLTTVGIARKYGRTALEVEAVVRTLAKRWGPR